MGFQCIQSDHGLSDQVARPPRPRPVSLQRPSPNRHPALQPEKPSLYSTSPAAFDPLAQATDAANALVEWTPFAIDDADDVLDEVRCVTIMRFCSLLSTLWQVDAFLEAHDTGVTDADREVAKGE
jgi:TBC1 domain family member 8/9